MKGFKYKFIRDTKLRKQRRGSEAKAEETQPKAIGYKFGNTYKMKKHQEIRKQRTTTRNKENERESAAKKEEIRNDGTTRYLETKTNDTRKTQQ